MGRVVPDDHSAAFASSQSRLALIWVRYCVAGSVVRIGARPVRCPAVPGIRSPRWEGSFSTASTEANPDSRALTVLVAASSSPTVQPLMSTCVAVSQAGVCAWMRRFVAAGSGVWTVYVATVSFFAPPSRSTNLHEPGASERRRGALTGAGSLTDRGDRPALERRG